MIVELQTSRFPLPCWMMTKARIARMTTNKAVRVNIVKTIGLAVTQLVQRVRLDRSEDCELLESDWSLLAKSLWKTWLVSMIGDASVYMDGLDRQRWTHLRREKTTNKRKRNDWSVEGKVACLDEVDMREYSSNTFVSVKRTSFHSLHMYLQWPCWRRVKCDCEGISREYTCKSLFRRRIAKEEWIFGSSPVIDIILALE